MEIVEHSLYFYATDLSDKWVVIGFLSFLKFGVTGLSGMVLDFSVTWLFKDVLEVNKFLANALGFTAAVISNYFINRTWTFKSKAKVARQFAGFTTVSILGLTVKHFDRLCV